MVTINDKVAGDCTICCESVVGYDAKFKDGLKGIFCVGCFTTILDKKIEAKNKPKKEVPNGALATRSAS